MSDINILYVEDEPYLAKIVKETLEGKGFNVKHLTSGTKAVDQFVNASYDICILDIMLPGKDGYTIGEEIRNLDPDIPIIFLTAKDQTKDLLKGFSVGGNDYIKKPFSMEELFARINNLLRLVRHKDDDMDRDHEEYSFGKFSFHPLHMELQFSNESIKLSHRETEILKMLCRHMNRQLDRKKILLKIWGDDTFFNSRNLDVYIRKIRKHLARDTSVQLLTLKGIGYRLIEEK